MHFFFFIVMSDAVINLNFLTHAIFFTELQTLVYEMQLDTFWMNTVFPKAYLCLDYFVNPFAIISYKSVNFVNELKFL